MKQTKKAKWAKHSNRSAERPEQLGKLKQNLPFSPGISGAAAPRRGLTALSPEYFIAEFRPATAFWAPAGGLAEYAASSINSRRHESNSRHRREHHFCTFTLPHILPGIVAANRSPISDKSRRPPQTSSYECQGNHNHIGNSVKALGKQKKTAAYAQHCANQNSDTAEFASLPLYNPLDLLWRCTNRP